MKKFIHGIIWGLLRKKSLGEIFYEMLLRKKSIIGFKRI